MLDRGDQREEVGWGVCVECVRSAVEEYERGESLRAGKLCQLGRTVEQIATPIAPPSHSSWGMALG